MTRSQRIQGQITRADGDSVSFAITPDGSQQWGVPPSELGQTADLMEALGDAAFRSGFFDEPAEDEPRGVHLTRDQLEAWAGRTLTDDEVDQLNEAIPNSSIPDAIDTIADGLPPQE